MKTTFKIIAIALLFLGKGCPDRNADAEIKNNIISTQITGSANDGDSTTPTDNYGPAGADKDAEDSKTKASSDNPTFNTLGAKAMAETLNPGGATIVEDEARGASFNKVVSQFTVTNAGAFSFDIQLDVKKVKLQGDGKMDITVQANILNNDGTAFPNGSISNTNFKFKKNQAGAMEVIIANDNNNPDQLRANGDYKRTLSGPNGGIQLPAGDYRIEFDLRVIATAPTAMGPNNQPHRAEVEGVKASIALR